MILIADSGSTKCDWLPLDDSARAGDVHDRERKLSTMGFNPLFHSSELVEQKVRENEGLTAIADRVEAVYYYGAACSSAARKAIIARGLQPVFPKAKVVVDHDLAGAAYATFDGEPGIVCILGTGSNSCRITPKKRIKEKVPALSFILGDEGSGAYFGKQFIRAYLYKELPKKVHRAFYDEYQLTKEQIFDAVYRKPNANVYLASFMRFISRNRDHGYIETMIRDGFSEFIDIHVLKFKRHTHLPVHFVGSVAHYFQDSLRAVCEYNGLTVGNIVKQPIFKLADYHLTERAANIEVNSVGS